MKLSFLREIFSSERKKVESYEPKKEDPKSIAASKIRKIIKTLKDINPSIKEFKRIYEDGISFHYDIIKFYSDQGERYIIITHQYNYGSLVFAFSFSEGYKLSSYNKQPLPINELYHITISESQWTDKIEICPNLTSKSYITEKEIFLSLYEIETVLNSYAHQTATEEHQKNVNNFINRFSGE